MITLLFLKTVGLPPYLVLNHLLVSEALELKVQRVMKQIICLKSKVHGMQLNMYVHALEVVMASIKEIEAFPP